MKQNTLAKTFRKRDILLYALPTICMMLFMSAYSIVDGIFVANYVNEDALSAVNIVMPLITMLMALGMMLAIGANALIGKLLGEERGEEARRFFSLVYLVGAGLGVLLTVVSLAFAEPLLHFLGASEQLYPYARDYLLAFIPFTTLLFLMVFTQSFFITAGKPMIGFVSCFLGGLTNIALDYVFIVPMELGITGAALATGIGYAVPGLFGLCYFSLVRSSPLHFVRPRWEGKLLRQSLYNGMSEFVSSIAVSITTLLFNVILLSIAGEDGVAAISVILYIQMIQSGVYMGYSTGVSPIISYKYGEQNHAQMRKVKQTSVRFLLIISVLVSLLSQLFAKEAVGIFIAESSDTFAMAVTGFRIFSISYLFMGLNVFASAFFTALSNGKVSALLSLSRTLVFLVIALVGLPYLLGLTGVWLAVPVAEGLALLLSLWAMRHYQTEYQY